MKQAIFVSGIDTDAGKTYVTGVLAREMAAQGQKVITQKFIQTGNRDFSEDIEAHRRIMGIPMQPRDLDHTTAPVIFSYPCSAQLAARIDGREIDLRVVDHATQTLLQDYDTVLVEGAGGLMVPISDTFMAIDYVASRFMPLVLVTNGRLGSINHTLLSLEAVKARGIELREVVYNRFYDYDPVIADDTLAFITRHVEREFPEARVRTVDKLAE